MNNKGKLARRLNTSGINLHQKLSFSRIFSSDIQGIGSNTILFPGCGLLSSKLKELEKSYEFLKSKIVGLGIYNKCCGKPSNYLGKEDEFRNYYKILEDEFQKKKIERIITGCQNCYATLGEYSQNIEIVSLWKVLAEIGLEDEKLGSLADLAINFTIHDPCPTRDVQKYTSQLGRY